ncbi:MAG: hypothetical protein A2Y45_06295 [Tenericutes bacterium GWC2_34_14]|nr:MAG: hypothetical protein A2Y45_06295 [Tenericutes bacterium GWC2_34_14]OHE33527.1 MAG: hypothetical protein A2012_03515 [Tenericutes bacterium GWE2_34_108]OHE36812.1 MAG: hypothetical protein A2Y46_09315 [Tenericutes bacterium GWF1_35_14]OHE38108.1 MAG: hypothetical protein A2Y44_09350 [Tenericutes bacterium GWF2_35_184]OHE42130.1 MAG: hypothetical protein A3K26_07010 [Tenericutes bacterium RIFOXYA12_FULL_35_10]OHE43375.1 MAG: hypothetical protein A2221_06385 [Tenericutes bacterium RIFOXYA
MINTENQYHNLAFWAWNGDMNDEEVIEQIQGFYRQGFGGFFIHARAGLTIPYMGKTWMHACDLAIQEAKRLGLSVWLYDEDGWPSGFAGGKVNALGKDYHIKKLNISYSKQEEVKGTVIAQYKKSTSGYQSCDQNQDADITIYYTSDEHYVDLLNPRVADAFLQYTHDQYFDAFGQYFGNTIKAMFTDEPQVFGQGLVWSNYLPDVFFQLHNYPIQTELYQLFFDNESGKKFRHDYFQTVNYAFYHHYTKPLADWCESHHISLTGHFSAEDGLCDQSACNGGVMSMYPLMQIPAIDFLGRRLPSIVLLKQIESIKNQFDKPFILSETFGCSGWSTTFSQFAWLWSYQAAHGINLACLHISTFSIKGIRKRDYPAFFSYQEPWWHQFHHLSSWMNRLNQLMSVGKKKPKVLVLNPISSIWSLSYLSDDQRHISNQYRLLLENLNDFQIDFDILDESLIEEYCVILNNQIYVNHKPYEMLIVPETINIETHTLKLLMEYNREQGHVVYTNKLPKYVSGISDDSLQQTIKSHRSPIVMNRKGLWHKFFENMSFKKPISFVSRYDHSPVSELEVSLVESENSAHCLVLNKSTNSKKQLLCIMNEPYKAVSMISIESNKITPIQITHSKNKNYFEIEINPMETLVFKLSTQVDNSALLKKQTIVEDIVQVEVSRATPNSLLLDRCSYSVENGPFEAIEPVIKVLDKVYAIAHKNQRNTSLIVRYSFDTQYLIENAEIHIESESAKDIFFNGINIRNEAQGWYIDKAIHSYPISNLICEGTNYLDVHYEIPFRKESFRIEDVYETERNRFYHPVDIENVYVTGDFNVNYIQGLIEKSSYYTLSDGHFELGRTTNLTFDSDLTRQGLWFYRGNIEMTFDVLYESESEVILKIDDLKAPVVEVFSDNELIGAIYVSPYQLDITSYLKQGHNQITLRVISSNRNLLGPHHHYKGEPNFVGVSTFKGQYGFEDFINYDAQPITWVESYSFIEFGLKSIKIIKNT